MNQALSIVSRHERRFLLAGIAALAVASWLYMGHMASNHAGTHDAMMMEVLLWPSVLMWAVMMTAMMLPAAAPAILVFNTALSRRVGHAGAAGWLFGGGYVLAWAGFSLAAAVGQWLLHELTLLSPAMALHDAQLAGGLLVAAGGYQWTPMKRACLRNCRSPLGLVAGGWPEGRAAALGLGLKHGLYCIGCCWTLMLLMFVGGVMNLLWMVLLTGIVLAEKVLPGGDRIATIGGALLLGGGLWLLLA